MQDTRCYTRTNLQHARYARHRMLLEETPPVMQGRTFTSVDVERTKIKDFPANRENRTKKTLHYNEFRIRRVNPNDEEVHEHHQKTSLKCSCSYENNGDLKSNEWNT